MSHQNRAYAEKLQLLMVESERLNELRKTYSVILNGAPRSAKADIISAIQFVEGAMEDIAENLERHAKELLFMISKDAG